jgi:hypothetical protein
MPPLINIFAYGNFDYDQVVFDLKGPVNVSSRTMKFPYALFEKEGGFTPFPGRYTLTVTATNKDASVVSNTMQFGISYGDSINITRDIQEWNYYPNPVETVLNIKLPEELPEADLRYHLINVSGQRFPIPSTYVNHTDNLANINLTAMQISSGIYFLQIENNGELLKQFRIFKK